MSIDFSKLAKDITKDCKSDKEKAGALYHFVKEEIKYKITVIGDPEKILKLGYGSCIDKTILFCVLAEKLEMRTRYHIVLVNIKPFFEKIPFKKIIFSFSDLPLLPHVYPEVLINGKWEKIDGPALDYDLEKHFPGGLLKVASNKGNKYIKDIGTFEKISDAVSFPYIKKLLLLFRKRYKDIQKILARANNYLFNLRTNKQKFLKGERNAEDLKEDIEKLMKSSL